MASVQQDRSQSHVISQLQLALSNESPDEALKTVVRLLRQTSDHYDWVGIYLVKEENLVLTAYAGEAETEHVTIPIGQGICGLAAKQERTIIVPDVNKHPSYLICFPSTRSEIAIPNKDTGRVSEEVD